MNTDNTTRSTRTSPVLQRTLLVAGICTMVSSALFAGAAHAHNTPKPVVSLSASSVSEVTEVIAASPSVAINFERIKVQTIDVTPKKPASISVQSATQTVKRPMPGTLSAPLESMVPTSSFGKRVSPITGAPDDNHLGQDYGAACGTDVYAADSGTVVFSAWHEYGGGNRVEVDHGDGLVTTYNHMESNSVKVGDVVDVGAVVGKVGTSGSSTGCHLHFETIKGEEKHVDPLRWTLVPITKK